MKRSAWFYGTATAKEFTGNRKTYLRAKKVSYILAGKEELDCKLAERKLYALFGIQTLLICGGGPVCQFYHQSNRIYQKTPSGVFCFMMNAEIPQGAAVCREGKGRQRKGGRQQFIKFINCLAFC